MSRAVQRWHSHEAWCLFFENWTRQLERHGMLELNSTIFDAWLGGIRRAGTEGKNVIKVFYDRVEQRTPSVQNPLP